MNGHWLKVVMMLVGLIVGGGISAAVGNAKYQRAMDKIEALEEKLEEEIEKIELRNDADYDVIMEMSRAIVRIETKLDALRLDNGG